MSALLREYTVLLIKKITVKVDAEDEFTARIAASDASIEDVYSVEWNEAKAGTEVIGERDISL